jgi:glyoxylase-like metal-dependent hydrolase (beta-lactamase superfamily II)
MFSQITTKATLAAASTLSLLMGASLTMAAPLTVTVHTAGEAGFAATSTLVAGDKDAILVDAQFTLSEAHRVAAMILESGKRLTQVFVTHAHPDHYFGAEVILKQFPGAKLVARPEVVAEIKALGPKKLKEWKPLYGTNLTNQFRVPEAIQSDALVLEGKRLPLVTLDAGESEEATAVYVPELKTLIAGDLAFDGVHLWLAEGRADQWLKNLDAVRNVGAIDRVIAGHRSADAQDVKDLLAVNAEYIRSFQKILAESKTQDEAIAAIKAKYPGYKLPIIAEIAVKTLKN